MATFGVYVIVAIYWKHESLLAAQAFTSIALVALLTKPVLIFIQALPAAIQCVGSFDRIQDYACYSNTQLPAKTHSKADSRTDTNTECQPSFEKSAGRHDVEVQPILLSSEGFSWSPTSPAVLHSINLQIQTGAFTVVSGPVGSGKTTLLYSILGETSSKTRRASDFAQPQMAFCSQEAWLENTTARQNIIGPYAYEEGWYSTVRTMCGLHSDFESLAKGDLTIVGNNGSNLSGGQRQRVVSICAVALH